MPAEERAVGDKNFNSRKRSTIAGQAWNQTEQTERTLRSGSAWCDWCSVWLARLRIPVARVRLGSAEPEVILTGVISLLELNREESCAEYYISTVDIEKDRESIKSKYEYIGATYLSVSEIEQLDNRFMQNSADNGQRVAHDVGSDIQAILGGLSNIYNTVVIPNIAFGGTDEAKTEETRKT